jgi:hypothetical protein
MTYDLDDFIVLCSLVRLQETGTGGFVSSISYWSSASGVEVVSHVVGIWEGRGGSSDFGTHVGDSGKTGTGL